MQLLPLVEAVRTTNFQEAIAATLAQACVGNWDYGEAWIPNQNGAVIQMCPAAYINTDKSKDCISALEQFRLCSQAFILTPGVGLPGRVWLSHQPEWICDVSVQSDTYFLRHYIAKAYGIRTGLGVPVLVNNQVLAVLVFFMLSVRSEDKQLIELATTAATQLGAKLILNYQ